jgi:hypothetical protein
MTYELNRASARLSADKFKAGKGAGINPRPHSKGKSIMGQGPIIVNFHDFFLFILSFVK